MIKYVEPSYQALSVFKFELLINPIFNDKRVSCFFTALIDTSLIQDRLYFIHSQTCHDSRCQNI